MITTALVTAIATMSCAENVLAEGSISTANDCVGSASTEREYTVVNKCDTPIVMSFRDRNYELMLQIELWQKKKIVFYPEVDGMIYPNACPKGMVQEPSGAAKNTSDCVRSTSLNVFYKTSAVRSFTITNISKDEMSMEKLGAYYAYVGRRKPTDTANIPRGNAESAVEDASKCMSLGSPYPLTIQGVNRCNFRVNTLILDRNGHETAHRIFEPNETEPMWVPSEVNPGPYQIRGCKVPLYPTIQVTPGDRLGFNCTTTEPNYRWWK